MRALQLRAAAIARREALSVTPSDYRAPLWQYSLGYFAAFVLDPGGNNIEAVFRESSWRCWYLAEVEISAVGRFAPEAALQLPKRDGPLRSASPGKPPRLGWIPKQLDKPHSGSKQRASFVRTGEPAFPPGYPIV
jgi:hypothetical protein